MKATASEWTYTQYMNLSSLGLDNNSKIYLKVPSGSINTSFIVSSYSFRTAECPRVPVEKALLALRKKEEPKVHHTKKILIE